MEIWPKDFFKFNLWSVLPLVIVGVIVVARAWDQRTSAYERMRILEQQRKAAAAIADQLNEDLTAAIRQAEAEGWDEETTKERLEKIYEIHAKRRDELLGIDVETADTGED
jgi:uncharacterized protein YhaN